MKIAVLTFDGFNEVDSFVAAYMINRVARPGWKAEITCPEPVVESVRLGAYTIRVWRHTEGLFDLRRIGRQVGTLQDYGTHVVVFAQ